MTFKVNTKLYAPIVTLPSKDNVKLVKLLEEGFKRPVCWNEYQAKIETRNLDNNVTLSDIQLKKVKTAVKSKTENNFKDEFENV